MIEAGACLERATVRGPAIIGAGSRIVDSYVGPYTAIDADVTIERSEVEHSIVLAGSRDQRPRRPDGGEPDRARRRARRAATRCPKAYRFVVGDNSEIKIH